MTESRQRPHARRAEAAGCSGGWVIGAGFGCLGGGIPGLQATPGLKTVLY